MIEDQSFIVHLQVNTVSADIVMNRAEFQWWSFHDVNTSLANGCGGLTGPMAIIVSEETPPRKFDTLRLFFTKWKKERRYLNLIR